ncbi:hypothetical protein BD324DRAFT_649636 [Kockovaella imperatae]|uniref:Uncharacterized protein n=1 Tax=Kockovaella imperatae TaxID=4999 RepID=A0A1Y1UJU8_9TREE|nr:hypothetical protein BD324DRAFT_649636 [Kockovaella imperatae]ORX38259.1 hypothetical protein BD324DRAFT_649636 [Kockovaella imperatae]
MPKTMATSVAVHPPTVHPTRDHGLARPTSKHVNLSPPHHHGRSASTASPPAIERRSESLMALTTTATRRPPPAALPHPDKPSDPSIPFCTHWRDYYPGPPLDPETILPKPTSKQRFYSTKWKLDNPNPKTREGAKAFYGSGMGMGYPGMMGGMGGMGGMGMGGMGGMGMGMGYPGMMGMMSGMGMMPGMMGGMGYGMPRYMPGGMYGGMGGYGGYGGMYDPMMGYGTPPAALFVDDNPDAHRIEHAYRQSMPDSYGVGLGMMGGMGGGMGVNAMPGSQMLLYGRGMGYGGWYA